MTEPGRTGRRAARFVFISELPIGGHRRDDEGDGLAVWWRLVAANNRVLGRSADAFASLAICRADALTVHGRADEVSADVAINAHGRWTWTGSLDGRTTVRSAHPYPRRIDCLRTMRLFLSGLNAADPLAPDVRHFAAPARRGDDFLDTSAVAL